MVRLILNITLTVLLLAGAAVTITVFQDMIGPGVGIMQISYHIAWMVFFTGLAAYFVLRIFISERVCAFIAMATGLIATVFAVMFMIEMINALSGAGFMDTLRFLFPAITIVVVGLLTLIVGGTKLARSEESK